MDLLEHFFQNGIIDEDTANAIRAAMQEQGRSFEQAALEAGVSETILRDEIAHSYEVPAYALETNQKIPYQVLSLIPEDSARHYKIIPLELNDGVLTVGANDPDDLQIREVLNFISTKHDVTYRLVFMLAQDVAQAIEQYESLTGEVDEALTSLQQEAAEEAEEEEEEKPNENLNHIKEDAPVTKIVGTILRYAVDGGASDIHIEPDEDRIAVRFRVDGSLQHSLELPRNTHSAVVARVKILSSMRLDEKRKPQDGRFSATFDGRKIDFRVSILPTNHDEKVVMRILDNDQGVTDLESTGISPHHLGSIRRMLKEPYGIILISGPTGSGKSTTLYTMLSEVDRATKNVMSLEDPVEYDIDGVSQSQMRPEIGYTFANGLRAALRQDPDIIMVGEIRDKETAQLAIQAALTGHLVLSTIHTNNSIGVIPRLIDMGIDPYLIAPTLKLAVAQRLAKRLCDGTGEEQPVDKAMEMMMEKEFESLPQQYHDRIPTSRTVLHPEPTPECATGLRGRVAIMETLEVDEGMQELILHNSSEEDIYHHARKNGFMSMKEDAIIKALNHVIPQEEVSLFGTKVGVENLTDDMVHDVVEDDSDPHVDNSANPPAEEV